MPDITYIIRFVCRDDNVERHEHTVLEMALGHYKSFTDEDADMYTEIDLIERNWKTNEDKLLKVRRFG